MLVGRHDFTSFRAAKCAAKSPVRNLIELSVVEEVRRLCNVACFRYTAATQGVRHPAAVSGGCTRWTSRAAAP